MNYGQRQMIYFGKIAPNNAFAHGAAVSCGKQKLYVYATQNLNQSFEFHRRPVKRPVMSSATYGGSFYRLLNYDD